MILKYKVPSKSGWTLSCKQWTACVIWPSRPVVKGLTKLRKRQRRWEKSERLTKHLARAKLNRWRQSREVAKSEHVSNKLVIQNTE